MAGGKPSSPRYGLTGAHDKLREALYNRLPGDGKRTLQISVDDALCLISDYFSLLGRVEGMEAGAEILKKELASRK
jgi:hypothetical protein